MHKLISSKEVGARLGVSQATILRAVAKGTIVAARTTRGGHHRFRPEDIDVLARAMNPELAGHPRLISTGEAARILGLSQHTVMRAVREGRLQPDETTPGGHHRFSELRIFELAPPSGEHVSTGGAARVLGVSVQEVRRAVHRGTLSPDAMTPGGHRRFATSQLFAEPKGHDHGAREGGGLGAG